MAVVESLNKGLALSGGREGAVGWNEGWMPWLRSSCGKRLCVMCCGGGKASEEVKD
jgi:hypothetical protein